MSNCSTSHSDSFHFQEPHMKLSMRHALVLSVAAAAALAAGCEKPAPKPAADAPASASTAKGAVTVAGLPTEKDQVSYMVGMAMAKQLEPVKDEVDVEVIA